MSPPEGLAASAALARVAWSQARRRPLQSGLLVLGVALGVAVVVAIDLANASALAAFRLSTEAVAGRATHRLEGGPAGLDEAVYTRLKTEDGLRAAAPVVEGTVAVPALVDAPLTLLGLDPFAEPPFRGFLGTGGGPGADEALLAFLTQPGAVLLSPDLAARAGLQPGEGLAVRTGTETHRLRVAGLLRPADALSRRALDGLLIVDLATAQEVLGRLGRLDRVDLLLPADPAEQAAALSRLRARLPAGTQLLPAGEQQAAVAAMTGAFQLNLTAMSLLALLVGMFLIFNTVRFGVVQRRPLLGTLRSLGVTRREVFAMVLAEAALLGALGALGGLALGVVLGRAAVGLVTRTISDLYFVVTVREVPLSLPTLALGALLGLCAALVAAALPAWEATTVPPITALRRSVTEARARAGAPRALALAGAFALLAAGLLALPGERVDLGFAGMAALVFAFALTTPAVTLALMALVRPITGRLLGVLGRMAPRDIGRSLSRTAVAIAALMVAVCVSIGVGLMVASFRQTVVTWLEDTLRADVFVTPAGASGTRLSGALDPALVARLGALPEVLGLSTAQLARLRSPELGAVEVLAVRDDIAGERRPYLARRGTPAEVWARLLAGSAVVVSEPFARRHRLGVGDWLRLESESGPRRFEVLGVYYDYGTQEGRVLMSEAAYRAGWRDETVASVALFLPPGVDADAFARALPGRLPEARLSAQSSRGLRAEVLRVFDQAFAITTALQLLALLVAFIGVLSALMSLQLERQREYATLRATGLTQRQLGGLGLLETGLVGMVAGLLSWPAGLSLALLLIYVINRRSFGWTIQTHLEPELFLRALALAVGAALLAGLYPTWRLGRLPIARALREE